MKVNGELILTVTTAIEPVTATIHAIVSEDIHDDCLISRADLELLERIPQGFPNAGTQTNQEIDLFDQDSDMRSSVRSITSAHSFQNAAPVYQFDSFPYSQD